MSCLLKFTLKSLMLFDIRQPEYMQEKYLLSFFITTIISFITMSRKELLFLESSTQYVSGYF